MSRNLDILRELSDSVKAAGSLGSGRGRYARTPDFAAPSHASSRPRSDRGQTFHFRHSTISKNTSISEGNHTQTHSAAHQGYIERPSATAESTPGIRLALLETAPGREISDRLHDGFEYPGRTLDPGRTSFGTTGTSKTGRKAFWNEVEAAEGKRARVQSRIVAELPAELGDFDRAILARDFCQEVFEERALPYWACIHAPSKKNDPRNHHLHITYLDRPCGRNPEGSWDFAITARKRMKVSGNLRSHRPFRNRKDDEARRFGWVRELRSIYADTCNFHLSISGLEKRHDPRSYRDSGIAKEPTEHLGNKVSALEGFGLETEPGKRNARREIRWRISKAEAPWQERAEAVAGSDVLGDDGMEEIREHLLGIASTGITRARKATSYLVAGELLTHRVGRRSRFLESEIARLSRTDDIARMTETVPAIVSLGSEAAMIADRGSRIRELSLKCDRTGRELQRQAERDGIEFDRLFCATEPDALFLADETPDLDATDDPAPVRAPGAEASASPELTGPDLDDIDALLGHDIREPDADEHAAEQPGQQAPAKPAGDRNKEAAGAGRDDPVERVISRLGWEGSDDGAADNGAERTADDFPEAWPIAHPEGEADLRSIDRSLREIDNRSLRQTAIANRDATDLCPPGRMREDLNRGWVVMRFEAERRGVDLDTGVHAPSRATDPERAALHADQDPCPIRVVRKNIARQRVRG